MKMRTTFFTVFVLLVVALVAQDTIPFTHASAFGHVAMTYPAGAPEDPGFTATTTRRIHLIGDSLVDGQLWSVLIAEPTHQYSGLASIDAAPDGSIYLVWEFNGFDDGVMSDTTQRMICKLHGLNVGLNETTQGIDKVVAYPNPGGDQVRLDWTGHLITSWSLRSTSGAMLMQSGTGTNATQFNAGRLSTGLYLISVSDDKGRTAQLKWMKP